MITLDVYQNFFSGYIITDCCIRTKNIIYFILEEDIESKGDDIHDILPDTRVVMYYPDESELKEQWAYDGFPDSKRMIAGVSFKPEERFIGVDAWGQVFVIGGGSSGFENPIGTSERVNIKNIKCIANGNAYAVGTLRTVYRRDEVNQWSQLTHENEPRVPELESDERMGFIDIDGFADNDLYTCGYGGEIMHFDGNHWTKLNSPTDVMLNEICCADDGQVYVAGNHGVILKGRDNHWVEITQNLTETSFDNIVWFKDRIYLSTWMKLYELVGNELKEVDPGPGLPPFYYGSGLSARDGILVTAGQSSALQFDGEKWSVLVGRQDSADLMDTINTMENLNSALDKALNATDELEEAIHRSNE